MCDLIYSTEVRASTRRAAAGARSGGASAFAIPGPHLNQTKDGVPAKKPIAKAEDSSVGSMDDGMQALFGADGDRCVPIP